MYKVSLKGLPRFSNMDQYDQLQLFFENLPAIDQYNRFTRYIYEALAAKTFFPVMRMCDGEYIYSVGKKKNTQLKGLRAIKFYMGKWLKPEITSWGESYTRAENKVMKKKFPQMLREIAQYGVIANHFLYSPSHFCKNI